MGMVNPSPELSTGDSRDAESVGVGLPPSALGKRAAKSSVAGLAVTRNFSPSAVRATASS